MAMFIRHPLCRRRGARGDAVSIRTGGRCTPRWVTRSSSPLVRNAYLTLECLVSDKSAKKKFESESAWLKRVLGGPLAPAIPSGMNINATVDDIYQHG
jgi:hypothetical protein